MTFKAYYCKMIKTRVASLCFDQNYPLPVVDLWQCPQHEPPPNRLKFPQIHAFFWKFWQNHMLVPPRELVPPPMGKPGFAPDYP